MSNNYNTCDGWYSIFNTLYLTVGISIIVLILTIFLIFLLILASDIVIFRQLFFILIYFNLFITPFILTHIHISNIKYKCSKKNNIKK